jgi:glutamate 5-kinase
MGKRYVVKVGSLGVSKAEGGPDTEKIAALARDLRALRELGHEVVLVSSGAINSGKKWVKKPSEKQFTLAWQQACAAVGMPQLMQEYQQRLYPIVSALVLVTHDDFKARPRFLNIRNTILTLLQSGVIPVVNENDTVSTREITVGDNDQLAAMVAEAIDADLLVLLTEADGLFDRDPKDPAARHLPEVDFREDFAGIKIAAGTSVGRGGMATKLQAVRRLTPLGQDVLIATFNSAHPVSRALSRDGGTLFKGDPREKVKKRKAWIASTARPACAIIVDTGAAKALKTHASLLPVGITKVVGQFRRGDVISVKCQRKTIAVGIVEYDAKDIEKIAGKKTGELAELLTTVHAHVVIHRNNLFIGSDS